MIGLCIGLVIGDIIGSFVMGNWSNTITLGIGQISALVPAAFLLWHKKLSA